LRAKSDASMQLTAVRILLQRLLRQQRQAVEAATHVGAAGRQPNPHPRRDRDHRRRPPPASAATAADSAATSTAPVIRIRERHHRMAPQFTPLFTFCGKRARLDNIIIL
jgi:hypothetical protein